MAIPLKYATASQEIPLGIFVDSTDGDSPETGLTVSNTDIWLWKSGATTLANKNSGGATHISNGIYYCTLDATDTNTYGPLLIYVHESGSLYLKQECWVMNPDAYDALFAASGTGNIETNVVEISGDSTAADNCEAFFDGTGYAGTNNVMPTVTTLTGHTAQTGDNYARLGTPAGASIAADIAENQADLNTIITDTNELQTDLTNGGRLDLILDELTSQGDTNETKLDTIITDTNELQTDLTNGGRLDLILDELTAQGDTNETKLDTVITDTNELQTDWTNGGRLDLIIDELTTQGDTNEGKIDTIDTNVDAILTDTGTTLPASLTAIETDTQDIQSRIPAALVGGRMDSDVEAINNNTTAADNLGASALGIVTGSVNDAAATTTSFVSDLTEATNDHYNGRIIVFTSGAVAGQATDITDYDGSTFTITMTALTEAPANSVTFVIV